jgi:signal transduction histidine kinase/ligand-binding sensor domain-containing protein
MQLALPATFRKLTVTTCAVRPKQTILLLLFFLSKSLCSQIPWRIDKLSVEEGLSQGYVYAIHQDKKGFLWIGTHGGLNRYDGYGFKTFQYMPFDSTSLGDNSVFFLKEDRASGKFWIGGSSCLNEFDPVTFTNRRFRYSNEQVEFADGIFVNEKELLLACQSRVLLFNTVTKQFKHLPVFDENGRPAIVSRVENVAGDRQGNYMIMSRSGVYFFDPLTYTCKRKTPSSPDLSPFYAHEVFNVLQDGNGNYWIATNKKGIIRYNAKTGDLRTIDLPAPLTIESLRFDVVTEDSRGAIWAGSSNGLFRINATDMSAEYFSSNRNNRVALSHPEINVIYEDRNHFMWIGTVGGGINKMIPQNAGFKNLVLAESSNGTNAGTYVMAMQESGAYIWFCNIWDQVGNVDISTGKITLLKKPLLPSTYSWYSEGAIVKNNAGKAVLLNGENMYELDTRAGKPAVAARPSPGLYHIHYGKEKTYYLVKSPIENPAFRNDTLFANAFFYDTEEDAKGDIWIGSSQGLLQLNTRTGKITQYLHNDEDRNSISSNFIYALEMDDSQHSIWMAAYNGGLSSFDMTTKKFRHFSREDGLADNIVYSMEKDNHGNLWFSTNAGISTYQVKEHTFRNYGKSDGLLNHEFNRQASCRNKDGWLFFGGIFGIDYFHPDSIVKTKTAPVLAFTNFRVFNKDYQPTLNEKLPVVELKHNDRYISIEFAALDYADQQKIQYAYRLDKNTDWIKLGGQHALSFSSLATGTHELQVRSTNAEGVWIDNQIACTINIHPSWWQTGWFRAVALLSIIAFGVLLLRAYYRRKLQKQKIAFEKQQVIERERTRIATDMHDDLGAGLTRIKFITENMMEQNGDPAIRTDVQKLRLSSNELVEKMGEIIWAMNEKNNSLEDLLFYLRSYAVDYCSENHLACRFIIPDYLPAVVIDGQTRRNIFLVLKESLHNIVKHAQAQHVTIEVATGKGLGISIKDDGKGFVSVPGAAGNGLLNMQRRAGDLKGKLTVSSNGTTTVLLEVPFL